MYKDRNGGRVLQSVATTAFPTCCMRHWSLTIAMNAVACLQVGLTTCTVVCVIFHLSHCETANIARAPAKHRVALRARSSAHVTKNRSTSLMKSMAVCYKVSFATSPKTCILVSMLCTTHPNHPPYTLTPKLTEAVFHTS